MSETMAMPVTIDGPLPLAPPYGLTPTVQIVDDGDDHWLNGAAVWGYPPGLPSVIAGCATGTYRAKDDAEAAINPTFGAFTVYLPFTCTKRSFRNYDLLKSRLLQAFDASDSWSVEHEFAHGVEMPLNPFLADPDCVLPNGSTAVSPAEGLALLEDYAAENTGRQAVIHATPGTVTAWTNTIVTPVGGKLRTVNGNLVVSGGGYIGATPDGGVAPADDQQAWVYATGQVQIRRTVPFIPQEQIEQALDREDNTVTLYAERYYLVDWDAELHAAVLIDRSIT